MLSSSDCLPLRFRRSFAVVLVLLLFETCTVSDAVVSTYTSDQPARSRHLSHICPTHWSYFWGLLKAELWDAECQDGSDMTQVKAKTNPLFITVSFLTLGIVILQRLEWDWAPPARDTGTIGTDN